MLYILYILCIHYLYNTYILAIYYINENMRYTFPLTCGNIRWRHSVYFRGIVLQRKLRSNYNGYLTTPRDRLVT